MNNYRRADRVADVIVMEMSELLRREVKDPRIGDLTVTGAKVSDDLRTARVFFVELGRDELSEELRVGLQKATGFLRRELGRRLKLRRVPELIFTYDKSFAYGSRIEAILTEIRREREDDAPAD